MHGRRVWRSVWILTACGWLSACGGDGDNNDVNAVQLSPVLSCEALEAELETVAQAELGAQLEALRQPSLRGGTADVALAAPTGVASAEANQAQGAGLDYSGTNNQERGVDEADIVKSDGQHLYVLSGGHLLVLRSHPATELAELSRLPVPGRPLEMFVHGDRALIFSELTPAELPPELPARSTGGAVDIAVPALACAPGSRCGFGGLPQTQLTLVDLSDRGAPRLLRENIVEARYLSSRRVGASVRVVVRGSTYMPVLDLEPQLDFDWYDDDKLSKRERRQLEAEIDRLESEGRARIQAHALADWLPRRLDIDHAGGGTRQVDSIAPCVRFFRDEGSQGRDVLDVITVNLDKDNAAPAHAAILGHGAEVYASTESLYIASHPWSSFAPWWGWQSEAWLEERTHVHRFDIALDPDQAVYVASGSVPGHLPGNGQTGEAQFAMDEADGRLRIATTTQGRGTAAPEGWQSENHLFILELGEGQLRQVGSVEGLAPGEQIFAARFVGNRGYLVTFRQVDPLFVFDLSDPSAPTLQASLKIPGFSTYMHPIGDTHLLTIGREADSNGIVTGLKLSLFDVADATAPRLAHEHIINDPSVVSEALHEHKAFSYFPAQSLLAVPLSTYRCDQSGFVGLRALNVDLQSGFQVLADLSHSAFYPPSTLPYCGYSGYADVRRSLRIEDHLYVLSGKAVTAHPLADLTAPATASVTLPDPRPAGDAWLW